MSDLNYYRRICEKNLIAEQTKQERVQISFDIPAADLSAVEEAINKIMKSNAVEQEKIVANTTPAVAKTKKSAGRPVSKAELEAATPSEAQAEAAIKENTLPVSEGENASTS